MVSRSYPWPSILLPHRRAKDNSKGHELNIHGLLFCVSKSNKKLFGANQPVTNKNRQVTFVDGVVTVIKIRPTAILCRAVKSVI